jgi:hypothetical protein
MGDSECAAKNDDQAATKAATAACNTSGSNKECSTAADATTDATTDATVEPATESGTSVASKSLATTASVSLIGPAKAATTAIGAANIVVENVLAPVIKNLAEFYGKIQSLEDVSFIENNLKLKNETELKANEIVLKNLLEKFMIDNKDKTDTSLLTQELNILKDSIDKILNPPNKVGGKKIISRTHKSINQFLNPKITAANIKSKRFRNTKSKSKYKSKKRTRY